MSELEDKIDYQWIETLCNKYSKWNNENSKKIPLIIRQEYLRVFSLLKEGQIYGAFFELKDVFEIILKINVVIVASEIINKSNYTEEEGDLLFHLFEKDLCIGDWESICRFFHEKSNYKSINTLSKEISKVYARNYISKWRNDWIGHGALAIFSNQEFINQIDDKISILYRFFVNMIEEYGSFDIVCKNNQCFFETDDNEIPLKFLIKDINNNMHIFDAYKSNKNKVSYLDYYNGNKFEVEEKEVQQLVSKLKKDSSIRMFKESNTDDILMIEEDNIIKEINTSKDFIKPDFIKDEIDEFIAENDSGVILIRMKRGMGKTTLSMALDNNSINKLKIDNCSTRAYYINDSYGSRINNFTSTINDLFRVDKDGKILFRGDIPMISSNSSDDSQELARLLNFYREKYYNMYGTEKLLLVLDGIDEINKYDKKTIFDFIPKAKELEKGVFILCTCRMDDELTDSNFLVKEIEKIDYNSKIIIDNTNCNYTNLLEKFIKKVNKRYSDVDIVSILNMSGYNFSNVRRICHLLNNYEIDLKSVNLEELSKYDVANVKNRFGEKYYKSVIDILTTLISLGEPLSLREINNLCFNESNDMGLLFYIYSIKDLLRVDRNNNGNRVYIRDVELLEYLKSIYPDQISQKLEDLLHKIYSDINEKSNDIDCGKVCICKNISNIITKLNKEIESSRNFEIIKYLNYIISKININLVSSIRDIIAIYNQVLFFLDRENNTTLKEVTRADILSKQGELYELYGLINESREKYKLSLDIFKKYETGLIFNKIYYENLIKYELLLYKIGEYEEAIHILDDIISSLNYENNLDKLEIVITAYCNRSLVYQQIEKIQSAKEDLDRAIMLIEASYEIEKFKYEISLCYLNRGTIYLAYEEYDNALLDIRKSIEYSNDDQVRVKVNRARALMNYSNVKIKMGETVQDVVEIIDEAIKIVEEIDRDDSLFDVDVLVKLYNNKAVLILKDKKQEAYELLSKTITLAEALRKQNRYYYEDELVRAYFLKAEIEERKEFINENYKRIIESFDFNSHNSIECVFCAWNNLFVDIEEEDVKFELVDIAYNWLSKIIETQWKIDEEEIEMITTIVSRIYIFYKENGNYDGAIDLIKMLLEIYKKFNGYKSENKAYYLKELGYCNVKLNRALIGLELYHESLEIYEKIQSEDILGDLEELIILYFNKSMVDISLKNYQNAYNQLTKCSTNIQYCFKHGISVNEELVKKTLQLLIFLTSKSSEFGIDIF
ncbi:tetratricopeptide repeat protein [Terrisporobacter vanillatitrophus]|uniref:tetratricopeptide repeat protein n=1 Tax=Terrisporobacter vanillatitrophus TaxID=3058402 RepID=UPI0033694D02